MRKAERALISVYDKTGILDFARGLVEAGIEVVSTGGTRRLLSANGIEAREIADLTGFPEILGGRVKTIHPKIAAGLLAIRGNREHAREVAENDVPLIDLVCVNLYPFAETVRNPEAGFDEVIENIDIGGPSMIRAAAKNFQDVAVVTSPEDYDAILAGLRAGNGALDRDMLFRLAQKAFLLTARYDSQIAQHLSGIHEKDSAFPPNVFMDFEKISDLRYGENPHQKAAFYRWGGRTPHGLAALRQLHGKELSYNNIVDIEAAWNLVSEFRRPACVIIKHTNPCGAAVAETSRLAYLRAYEGDMTSAFGSIVGFNTRVDRETAIEAAKLFVEAIVAPEFDAEALAILGVKKNLRLLEIGAGGTGDGTGGVPADCEMKRISGGMLLQSVDDTLSGELRTVTRREPTPGERRDLEFAWRVVKHVKSNAIVLAENGRTVGVGAGQTSRVDSVKLSVQKAYPTSKGAVLASDAFFPFRDGIDAAALAGVTAVIQPGGSVKDPEVIQAADEHDIAMIFTGLRHFKH